MPVRVGDFFFNYCTVIVVPINPNHVRCKSNYPLRLESRNLCVLWEDCSRYSTRQLKPTLVHTLFSSHQTKTLMESTGNTTFRSSSDHDDQEEEETIRLEDIKEKIACLLPIIPALLSIAASTVIIHLVCKSRFKTPYKRILFGWSCADWVLSFLFLFNAFLLPSGERLWTLGNDATCSVAGMLTQMAGFGVVYYPAALSTYFTLTIRYNLPDARFVRYYEIPIHSFAVVFAFGTAIFGAVGDYFHATDIGRACWFDDQHNAHIFGWAFGASPILLSFCIVIINNVLIYTAVRRQMRQGRQRSSDARRQTQRMRQVGIQAFLYIGSFLGTNIPSVVLGIAETDFQRYPTVLFAILVVQCLVAPSTGIFTFLIFLRPRYLKVRSENPNESRFQIFCLALESARQSASSEEPSSGHIPGLLHRTSSIIKSVSDLLNLNSQESLRSGHGVDRTQSTHDAPTTTEVAMEDPSTQFLCGT